MEDTTDKMRIVVYEKADIVAELKRIADDEGLSQAALIRMLIRAAIREAAEKITATPQTN